MGEGLNPKKGEEGLGGVGILSLSWKAWEKGPWLRDACSGGGRGTGSCRDDTAPSSPVPGPPNCQSGD